MTAHVSVLYDDFHAKTPAGKYLTPLLSLQTESNKKRLTYRSFFHHNIIVHFNISTPLPDNVSMFSNMKYMKFFFKIINAVWNVPPWVALSRNLQISRNIIPLKARERKLNKIWIKISHVELDSGKCVVPCVEPQKHNFTIQKKNAKKALFVFCSYCFFSFRSHRQTEHFLSN